MGALVKVYYNDNEPFVVQWLRNLMAAGHLPQGEVDERPIQEVQPDDLKGYDQCHFFAGIGTPSSSPDGPMTDLFGLALAPASHSLLRAYAAHTRTIDTLQAHL